MCSHLGGSGGGCCQFMQYLDRWDSANLRLVCKELYEMTKNYEFYMTSKAKRAGSTTGGGAAPQSPWSWPLGKLQGHVKNIIQANSELTGMVRKPNGNIVVVDSSIGQVLEYAFGGSFGATGSGVRVQEPKILAVGLVRPLGLALRPNGCLYVSDAYNVRYIDSKASGTAALPSTELPPVFIQLDRPALGPSAAAGLCVSGNILYVLESKQVRAVSIKDDNTAGEVLWSRPVAGHGSVTVHNNTVYMSDYNNHLITRIDLANGPTAADGSAASQVQTICGRPAGRPPRPGKGYHNGLATQALFAQPAGMVWHNSMLYIVDSENMCVRQLYKGLTKKCQKALLVKDLCGSKAYKNIYNDDGAVIERIYEGPFFTPYGICEGPNGSLLVSDRTGVFEIT